MAAVAVVVAAAAETTEPLFEADDKAIDEDGGESTVEMGTRLWLVAAPSVCISESQVPHSASAQAAQRSVAGLSSHTSHLELPPLADVGAATAAGGDATGAGAAAGAGAGFGAVAGARAGGFAGGAAVVAATFFVDALTDVVAPVTAAAAPGIAVRLCEAVEGSACISLSHPPLSRCAKLDAYVCECVLSQLQAEKET